MRASLDEFAVFQTETDERYTQLESTIFKIERALKELSKAVGCLEGGMALNP